MYRFSKNRIFRTDLITVSALIFLLLPALNGCVTTSNDSIVTTTSTESEVSQESYTRILQQGQIIGYIGEKSVTVTEGGSRITALLYNIYDQGFQILGSYDEAGTTHHFTRNGPVKLGNFSREQAFRQVTGIEGILEFQEGLQ